MDEQTIVNAFKVALEQSDASFGTADVLLLVAAQITGIAVLFIVFWKFSNGKKGQPSSRLDVDLSNAAHKVMMTEDEYHQPVILSIPRLLKEFKEEVTLMREGMVDLGVGVKHLTNHNVDMLKELRDDMRSNAKK